MGVTLDIPRATFVVRRDDGYRLLFEDRSLLHVPQHPGITSLVSAIKMIEGVDTARVVRYYILFTLDESRPSDGVVKEVEELAEVKWRECASVTAIVLEGEGAGLVFKLQYARRSGAFRDLCDELETSMIGAMTARPLDNRRMWIKLAWPYVTKEYARDVAIDIALKLGVRIANYREDTP